MERRHRSVAENGLTPQDREYLERIVVRLLDIAARCADAKINHELMQLADELVKFIER